MRLAEFTNVVFTITLILDFSGLANSGAVINMNTHVLPD